MEYMSADGAEDIHARIARTVRSMRAHAGLSLDALAQRSGVSRAMISLIERGESGVSAAVLDKLAAGLGVALAALFDPQPADAAPLARRAGQPVWRDPESGYLRRSVSPPGQGGPAQLVEVEFPPGKRVVYDSGPRDGEVHQLVWMLEGSMEVRVGEAVHRLDPGDCLAMQLDQPTAFRNPTRQAARYAVVVTHPRPPAAARQASRPSARRSP